MNLPQWPGLYTNKLAACFNNTSATYKFYWFLAILHRVEQSENHIRKIDLFAEMIAHSWFTVNYFHISFGKQDKLQHAIERIKDIEGLTVDASRESIINILISSGKKETHSILNYFNSEVPHRFLSPWFSASDRAFAYSQSQEFSNDCPYALYKDGIIINEKWRIYFIANVKMLRDFCYWNLAVYLQTKNPNVPDIPNKLIRIPVRKALTAQRKQFWDIVLVESGGIDCIYTNTRLHVGAYAMEHFIPFAFVAHDLIWNLIPANPSFNSSKSDKLPRLDVHFASFYKVQSMAVEIIERKFPSNQFLEDYLTLFASLEHRHFNYDSFHDRLQPLIHIASNNGFQYMSI